MSLERNKRVQERYDELAALGKHGHYETMFQVVREEIERATMGPAGRCGSCQAIIPQGRLCDVCTAMGVTELDLDTDRSEF